MEFWYKTLPNFHICRHACTAITTLSAVTCRNLAFFRCCVVLLNEHVKFKHKPGHLKNTVIKKDSLEEMKNGFMKRKFENITEIFKQKSPPKTYLIPTWSKTARTTWGFKFYVANMLPTWTTNCIRNPKPAFHWLLCAWTDIHFAHFSFVCQLDLISS